MVLRLRSWEPDFEARFAALLGAKREVSEEVDGVVHEILAAVRQQGDAAVRHYTERFDRHQPQALRISNEDIETAVRSCDPAVLGALRIARDRIRSFHDRQRPGDERYTDEAGVELGWRWTALQSVGIYVPGGTASYPSSVLMNAIPAIVAGVERIVMVVPTPDGVLNPLVLAAAQLAGVSEIYRVGGAQAIGALAYGTETIPPVVKIIGPGNAYVAAAKRQVFGTVGIDMIAGPSEVLVLADGGNDPAWLAADLLAQAEHDASAQSILITDDEGLADGVEAAVHRQLGVLPRADIARRSWAEFGAILLVREIGEAIPLIDRIAPEHLELAVDDPEHLLPLIRNAGAVFLGRHTPEAVGDYLAGPNHVLPTARSARFASGLSVLDFMKRTTILRCSPGSLRALAPEIVALANAEGVAAHARSVEVRLNL